MFVWSNALLPTNSMVEGMEMLSSEVHPRNAMDSIFLTVDGRVTDLSDEQSWNACLSRVTSPSDRFTVAKLRHSRNAYRPTVFTVLGIVIDLRFWHSPKDPVPMASTEEGNVTEDRELPANSSSGITFTPSGISQWPFSSISQPELEYETSCVCSRLIVITPPFALNDAFPKLEALPMLAN